jgi:hypothetical protein
VRIRMSLSNLSSFASPCLVLPAADQSETQDRYLQYMHSEQEGLLQMHQHCIR